MAKCSRFVPYVSVSGAFSGYHTLRGFIMLLPLLFATLLLSLQAAAEDNTSETEKELSADEVAAGCATKGQTGALAGAGTGALIGGLTNANGSWGATMETGA